MKSFVWRPNENVSVAPFGPILREIVGLGEPGTRRRAVTSMWKSVLFWIFTVSRLTTSGVATDFSTSAAGAPGVSIAGAWVGADSTILDSIVSRWRPKRV